MKTPITDKHADECMFFEDSLSVVDADIARRLESDRASLMASLEGVVKDFELFRQIASANGVVGTWGVGSLRKSESALSAARANFPDHE